jgi:hypothetical protein
MFQSRAAMPSNYPLAKPEAFRLRAPQRAFPQSFPNPLQKISGPMRDRGPTVSEAPAEGREPRILETGVLPELSPKPR